MLLRLVRSNIKINGRLLSSSFSSRQLYSTKSNPNKTSPPYPLQYDKTIAENIKTANTSSTKFETLGKPEKSAEDQNSKAGLIATIKSGGAVSITLWVVWNFAFLGIFYAVSAFGLSKMLIDLLNQNDTVDVEGLENKFKNLYGAWMGTNLIVAVIVQKLAAPIRIGSYMFVLPFVLKLFKRKI